MEKTKKMFDNLFTWYICLGKEENIGYIVKLVSSNT